MGPAIDAEEWERTPGRFFARRLRVARQAGERHRCVDDTNLQGTIPPGQRQGVHLLAAWLPPEGVVLVRMPVKTVGKEISEASTLLSTLDMRGTAVSGDANVAASALSRAILKEHRSQRYQEMRLLCKAQPGRPGWPVAPMDFRQASSEDHGHGREETRQITLSRLLAGSRLWPGLSPVFTLERQRSHAPGEGSKQRWMASPVCPPPPALLSVYSTWFVNSGRWSMASMLAVIAPFGTMAPRSAWATLPTCWLCSTPPPGVCLPIKVTPICLGLKRSFASPFDRALAKLASSRVETIVQQLRGSMLQHLTKDFPVR